MPENEIDLVATQALEYRGAAIESGAHFSAPPIEAAALTYQHKARFRRPGEMPPAAPAKRSRRRASAPKAKKPAAPRARQPRRQRRDIVQPAHTK